MRLHLAMWRGCGALVRQMRLARALLAREAEARREPSAAERERMAAITPAAPRRRAGGG